MFPLLLIAVLAVVVVLVAIHVWTFRVISRRAQSAWWSRGAAIAVSVGFVSGLVSGVVVRWRPEPGSEYVGFPIPGMVVLYEDGRWVDYVGPTVVICPLLNALLVATVFLLPVSIALLIRRLRGLGA